MNTPTTQMFIKKLSALGNKVKRRFCVIKKWFFSLINHRGTLDNSKAWQ